ncbi:hypothetical protein ACHAXR_011294 [Thalassiosira sp. AJA248-18]
MSRRVAALNDAQKGDLARLWERHAPDHALSIGGGGGGGGGESSYQESGRGYGGRGGRGGRGRGRGGRGGGGGGGGGIAPTQVVTMSLEDEDYIFICRLFSFLRWIIDSMEQKETRQQQRQEKENQHPDTTDADGNDDDGEGCCKESRVWESLSFLFQRIKAVSNNNETKGMIVPRIMGGKQIITFNHSSFLEEFGSYEDGSPSNNNNYPPSQQSDGGNNNNNSSFGSYLNHYPDRAFASMGCAIGLNVLTLWRRHQSFTSSSNPLQQRNDNNQHPHLSTFNSAIYRPRLYNLAPSSHIRMAHIRTSTVGRLVSLRGTVTKARPKRLRVLDAGFVCCKCGLHLITKFMDGKYCSPSRCDDMKCRSKKFVLNRRVATFCDVQELKIQEVREEFCEDMENMENGESMGMSGESRDAGRAPRHMEVEVAHDLVDLCHAGDSIVVAGIVKAVNSALASGRTGKRAAENSTYKLYVVGHSIVNLTAEDGSRGGGDHGNGKHGMDSENECGRNKRSRTSSSSANMHYSDQQLQQIANLAHADHKMYSMPTRMAFPFDLLVRSLCPNIIGNDLVKAGIVLCLLGGSPPEASGLEAQSGMTIRSNSHMLVVGDPGMGKSQMLLSANQVAARSVYVGGNTASSTGLTVSLTKEPGGDMGIEAGALVLADRGVCCLDELDKMPKSHQDGLLEAMEQQQVSIAKAGVVASLPSRCSVIAAANPKSGHYNWENSVSENVNMAGPLLSRFDLVFILRDEADVKHDKMISGSIMDRLRRGDPNGGGGYRDGGNGVGGRFADAMDQFGARGRVPLECRLPWVTEFQKQPLPLQLLKDYIAYAREYCRPKMTAEAAMVLQEHFLKLRHPGQNVNKKDNVPITTRQLEALIRLSQARAKACLRPMVLREDAEDVVELMMESVRQVHTGEGGIIDKSRGGAGGKSKNSRKFLEAMRNSGKFRFCKNDLQGIAGRVDLPVGGFEDFLENLRNKGDILKGSDGYYTLA